MEAFYSFSRRQRNQKKDYSSAQSAKSTLKTGPRRTKKTGKMFCMSRTSGFMKMVAL